MVSRPQQIFPIDLIASSHLAPLASDLCQQRSTPPL
jgi:hypothetical protein